MTSVISGDAGALLGHLFVRRRGGCFGQFHRPPAALPRNCRSFLAGIVRRCAAMAIVSGSFTALPRHSRGTSVAVFAELHSSGESQGGGVGDRTTVSPHASFMGEGQETSAFEMVPAPLV